MPLWTEDALTAFYSVGGAPHLSGQRRADGVHDPGDGWQRGGAAANGQQANADKGGGFLLVTALCYREAVVQVRVQLATVTVKECECCLTRLKVSFKVKQGKGQLLDFTAKCWGMHKLLLLCYDC